MLRVAYEHYVHEPAKGLERIVMFKSWFKMVQIILILSQAPSAKAFVRHNKDKHLPDMGEVHVCTLYPDCRGLERTYFGENPTPCGPDFGPPPRG